MKLLSITLPYLLLVTFYTKPLNQFGPEKIAAINASPYRGVAVPLIGAYDTGQYSLEDFTASMKRMKHSTQKHLWPWVFFNRFIAQHKAKPSPSALHSHSYFISIKAMDINNEAGALGDFYRIWKLSLQIAKALNSPGIVIDPEAYNNYDVYHLAYIASETRQSSRQVKQRLIQVGRELLHITNDEYPDAILWFLFTGLEDPVGPRNTSPERQYRSVSYIIKGILEQAKESRSTVTIVSGGEVSLGYCHQSLNDLKTKVASRNLSFAEKLQFFSNLRLGATMAPWNEPTLKTGWMLKGKCGSSELTTIRSFKPILNHLKREYSYIWIYAAGAARYNPYDNHIAYPYNQAIRKVR